MSFRGFVTNLDLYVALREHNDIKDFSHLCDTLVSASNVGLSENMKDELSVWCRRFCYRLSAKWQKSRRCSDQFRTKFSDWLESTIIWPECFTNQEVLETDENCSQPIQQSTTDAAATSTIISQPSVSNASTSTSAAITRRKPFEDLSNKQKKRRTLEMRTSFSEDELLFSTECALKSSGNKDLAIVLNHLIKNPDDVSKVLEVIKTDTTSPQLRVVSVQKALALYVSMKLSKWRYITLRDFSLGEGLKFPSYYMLLKEKNKCYPSKDNIVINEKSVRIRLQALLDLTLRRLMLALKYETKTAVELVLHSKWGLDGASSQSVYNQKPSTGDSAVNSDNGLDTVVMGSIVPLSLKSSDGDIIWQNEKPSSTNYCRPWFFKFEKETESLVKEELVACETEIANLTTTAIENVSVSHNLMLTMIDGKIHCYLSDTSGAVCDLCKARPTEMNQLDEVRAKTVNEDMFKHGLSSLHMWIRSMECLLHIAYKLDVKSWRVSGDEMKKLVQEKKTAIQDAFRKETGIVLDMVKQGRGNTNTGNTARRFFSDPELSSRLTGLNCELIRRIAVILKCISCGERINVDNFRNYCNITAELYVRCYEWYYMPSSLHKLLIHGPSIVEHSSIVPIGYLSEEASEARNKDFRKYREDHTRKCSAVATNEDILHNLLLSSDPLITSQRPIMKPQVKQSSFEELNDLLIIENTDFDFIDVSLLEDDLNNSNDDDSDDYNIDADDEIDE